MSRPIRVRVTQKDIDYGVPRDPSSCPIARALKRQTHRRVSVAASSISIIRNGVESSVYTPPDEAAAFIRRFDSISVRFFVRPFTFLLRRPKK